MALIPEIKKASWYPTLLSTHIKAGSSWYPTLLSTLITASFRREDPNSREHRVKGVWCRKDNQLYHRSSNYMAVLLHERWVSNQP